MLNNKMLPKNKIVTSSTAFLQTRIDQELDKEDELIDWDFIDRKMNDIMDTEHWDMEWAPDTKDAYAALMKKAETRKSDGETPAGSARNRRRSAWTIGFLIASLTLVLASSVYAGHNGRVPRYAAYVTLQLSNQLMPTNYTRTDFQTDSWLYQTLQNYGMEETLLPDASLLKEYSVRLEKQPFVSRSYVEAEISWRKGDSYFNYNIITYNLSESFLEKKNFNYEEHEVISRDGLTIQLCRNGRVYKVFFQANNSAYIIDTNLRRSELLPILESIH